MKIVGRVILGSLFLASALLVFSDIILYLSGLGGSRISPLDTTSLTYLRDGSLNFGGPGVHIKQIKYYMTPKGTTVALYQGGKGEPRAGLFIRGKHKVYDDKGFEDVTTYEPFVWWSYLLTRTAVLFIVSCLILAAAGLALKFIPKHP